MKTFVEPIIEIEKFELVDVITTSENDIEWGMGEEGV